jgi:O-antigen/teichoic acid export membrane protein
MDSNIIFKAGVVLFVIIHLYSLAHVYRRKESLRYKLRWTVVILMLFPIGSFLYFLLPNPEGMRVDAV